MGRSTIHNAPKDFAGTVTLQHVQLDDGGYDPNGTYFGVGHSLYWYASEDGEIDAVLRAKDCADAKRKVLEIYPKAKLQVEGLVEFLNAYIACALWVSMDESDEDTGGEPMATNYGPEDLADKTREEMRRVCAAFLEANAEDIGDNYSQAGHDLWLSRNGHGVSFLDRDCWSTETAKRLVQSAKQLGECWIYVGDDGKIHL